MIFTDPIAFEEFLVPAGGEVHIRPVTGSLFRANIEIHMAQRVGLFTIEADSFSAEKAPQQDFYGFNIPLNTPFTISDPDYKQTFNGSNGYMLSPGRPLNFQSRKKCHVMICHFFVEPLEIYKESLLQESTASEQFLILNPHVSLTSVAGSRLFRSTVKTWIALGVEDSSISEIALQEMEDDLLASFILLAEDSQATGEQAHLPADYQLKLAEEYICANLESAITRDDLANISGVSIRSLSRAFEKKYETSPMSFVRQRRLDACFARLRGSEPGTTTVTDVALMYGFNHVGKFAIAFRKAFGESPSASLKK